MKISIITVTYNSAATIRDTLNSIEHQTHVDREHIVIDGVSSDGTLDILSECGMPDDKVVSEPDSGIYDAMNKGIKLASGDIVGILNSDDFFCNEYVLEKINQVFESFPIDALFADLVYVRPENLDKIVRYYSGAGFTLKKFAYGWMPPHPTFFVKRECYEKYGLFKTDYKIAADFELLVRFLMKHRTSYHYLPEVIIKMRTGGVSTKNLKSNLILNREILRACTENGVSTNMLKIYSKYFCKSLQLFRRPA